MGLARVIGLGLTIVLALPPAAPRLTQDPASRPDQVSEAPLWLDAWNQPNERARQALAVLADATSHGLDPADYRPGEASLGGGPRLESDLTRGLIRYLGDLRVGRADPRVIGLRLDVPHDVLDDLPVRLRLAALTGRLPDLVAEQAPRWNQYQALRTALGWYRALASDDSLPPLPAISSVVRPGDPFPGAAALHARLVAFGDIAPVAPTPIDNILSAELADGLMRYQARHGLAEDGIIGKQTLAELQVPLTWRATQIELALERLRWLPRDVQGPVVAVSIPMFRLWAFEAGSSGATAPLTMKVIVGCASRTRTPIFAADLKAVIFRPYWNIPPSILRGEVLRRLRRDAGYLTRNRMEIVRGDGDNADVVPLSSDALNQLARGTLRVRQQPGPDNSLGLVKFDFPNPYTVYMHGTPAVQLYEQSRRDLSHGCIRVEDPAALAEWVLADPAWTRQAIVDAMNGVRSRSVPVERLTRVLLFYTTVLALPEGPILFVPDIYGHDEVLTRALRNAPKM